MSEKQLQQTNYLEASLPKKSKSKRKRTATRRSKPSNKNISARIPSSNGAGPSSSAQAAREEKGEQNQQATPKNTSQRSKKRLNHRKAIAKHPEYDLVNDIAPQSEHEAKITVAQEPEDTGFKRDETRESTFFDALFDLDAFVVEDEEGGHNEEGRNELHPYIEAAFFMGIEQDAFLLADEGEVTSPEEEAMAPASDSTPLLTTPVPTDTDAHPIIDFEEAQNADQAVLVSEDEGSNVTVEEQDVLPQIIDTPLPASIEEEELRETPYSVKEWYPEGEPLPPISDTPLPSYSYKPWYERKRLRALRRIAALCLLAVCIASWILLWHDLTDTHLYVYTLNPSSGEVLGQQEIGSGYSGKTTLTDPVEDRSTLVFGVRTSQISTQVKQQVFTLTGRETSWHVDNSFAAPLTSGTLSTTTNGDLILENANGLQVITSSGHLLWSISGDSPALGAHAFQPVSGSGILYTVKSAQSGEVAAFDDANGAFRWMETLNDTFHYSPPLLLSAGILYIAGDSNLYALNSVNGNLLWQKSWAARSLFLLNNGQSHLLLTVGAQGLAAFDAATGKLAWSFHGQPGNKTQGSLTAAQFYQAGIDSGNKMIYATGIAWDMLSVREQLWLYAVNATTGALRWSEPVGSGFVSADAGRTFTPLVNADYGFVALEQEQDNNQYSISAFDISTGASLWKTQFDGESAAAPMLLSASSETLLHHKIPRNTKHINPVAANIPDTVLILPITQSNVPTALHSWSHIRILLMSLIALSLLGILLLWMLPLHLWILRQQDHIHNAGRYLLYPLKLVLQFWRYSHRAFALAMLLLFLGAGVLEYIHLNQPENGLYSIAGSSGNTQWQRTNTSPTQTLLADAQGSIDNFTTGDHLHQLFGLDRKGGVQWTTFASEGVFSAPSVTTQPGTVLVTLSGPSMLNYQFAPDDPAYPHLEQHLLNLYLLNRGTGQILWQSNVVRPDSQQNALVLGADGQFIYLASRDTNAGPHNRVSTMELIAVNSSTGDVEWRIFGPHMPIDAPNDYGSLLLQGRLIFWQVTGTLYSIDTTLGQIQWRRSIPVDDLGSLLKEEPQMAETAGVLLVERSSIYHVLDAASGNELQSIPDPNTDTAQSLAGVIAIDNIFLIYGDSAIEAINATTQQIIWKQGEFDAITGLKISNDKSMIYLVQLNSIGQSLPTPVQVLTALDVKTGAVRWTFQPSSQASFINPQSDGFQYSRGMLFATICMSNSSGSCSRKRLYAINAITGNTLWKFEAKSIFDLHVSSDGGAVLLQTDSTEWINLIGRFRS